MCVSNSLRVTGSATGKVVARWPRESKLCMLCPSEKGLCMFTPSGFGMAAALSPNPRRVYRLSRVLKLMALADVRYSGLRARLREDVLAEEPAEFVREEAALRDDPVGKAPSAVSRRGRLDNEPELKEPEPAIRANVPTLTFFAIVLRLLRRRPDRTRVASP